MPNYLVYSKRKHIPIRKRRTIEGDGFRKLNDKDREAVQKFKRELEERIYSSPTFNRDTDTLKQIRDEFNKKIEKFEKDKNKEYRRYINLAKAADKGIEASTGVSPLDMVNRGLFGKYAYIPKIISVADDVLEASGQMARHFDYPTGSWYVPEADKTIIDDYLLNYYPPANPYSFMKYGYKALEPLGFEDATSMMRKTLDEELERINPPPLDDMDVV